MSRGFWYATLHILSLGEEGGIISSSDHTQPPSRLSYHYISKSAMRYAVQHGSFLRYSIIIFEVYNIQYISIYAFASLPHLLLLPYNVSTTITHYSCHAQTNTFLSSLMPLCASSMRHRCCPSSSTSLRLSRRRSRFIQPIQSTWYATRQILIPQAGYPVGRHIP